MSTPTQGAPVESAALAASTAAEAAGEPSLAAGLPPEALDDRDGAATRAEYEGPVRGAHQESSAAAGGQSEVALSIAGAARGLGVATATLRSWERRYGLAASYHTSGGHRRYGPDDLARLQVMHRLVRAGVPAAEAARMAIAADVTGQDRSGPFAALLWPDPDRPEPTQLLPATEEGAEGTSPAATLVPDIDRALVGDLVAQVGPDALVIPPALPDASADQGAPSDVSADLGPLTVPDPLTVGTSPTRSHGGGRVLPLPPGAGSARGLASSVMALDAVQIERVLAESLVEQGATATWEGLVRPVMNGISRRWDSTGAGVEIEHTFSVQVAAELTRHVAGTWTPRNDRPVLLAAVPEEMHDLPLVALQATLYEERIRCHLLGARTPADALTDAVRRLGPPVVFLWAQLDIAEVPTLPRIRPRPVVLLGGPGFSGSTGATVAAESLSEAVDRVRSALGL